VIHCCALLGIESAAELVDMFRQFDIIAMLGVIWYHLPSASYLSFHR